MAAWSHSPFLQALGWAMLNSFWQMALLFAGFNLLQQLFSFSAQRRYYLSIGSLGAGLIWFVYTFFAFYQNGTIGTILTQHDLAPTSQTWNLVLSSASLTYLLLLLIPAYRLARNWRYIEHLKKFGLQKTAMEYRLFVKKIAQQLGIRHTVHVYLSELVHSPVTIGYLKPMILLPIAAINKLSTQQVEAVLLHELSHIKRYDYLVNFIIMLLQTLFYFNPFVKKFVSLIEFEREKCCDELVLQFEYDKISYAAALLLLERNVRASETLTLAAAGKSHLLFRIEKILGLKKKARFTFHQFAGIIASALVVLFINSLLFVKNEVKLSNIHTFTAFENPLYQFDTPVSETFSNTHNNDTKVIDLTKKQQKAVAITSKKQPTNFVLMPEQPVNHLVPVVYDLTDEQVTPEEKAHIEQTLETTKKVVTKMKWKEVEASIGDDMTQNEKKAARKEYLKAVSKINWKTLENQLKSNYQDLDWTAITSKLDGALVELKLDSLQVTYHQILSQIKQSQEKASCKAVLPVPDATVKEVDALKNELKVKIDSIKVIQTRKTINF
jgi:bla regulator protein blaR1